MTKSVYPPPPPTRNDLTPHQRSQLLRSTRKLSKILGTTPRLVDAHVPADPILLDLPLSPGAFEDTASFRLSSESLSSLPSTQHTTGFSTSAQPHYSSTAHAGTAPSRSVNSSSSSVDDPYQLEELWPALKQPPLHISLRPKASLSRSRSSSMSSHRDSESRSRHNRSPTLDGFCSQSDSDTDDDATHLIPYFTYSAPSPSKARDTILTSPSASSTLDNSLRRQKMERVTKTLGERVPWKLVFPPENEPWWKGRADTPAGTRKRASSFNIPRVPVPILESDEETTDEENVVTVGITLKPTNERGRKVLSMILE